VISLALVACRAEPEPTGTTPPTVDPAEALARAIDLDAMRDDLAALQALADGAAGVRTPDDTRAWAHAAFADAGWETEEPTFAIDGSWVPNPYRACAEPTCPGANVIATWPGTPDGAALLVGAHLDTVGNPGINDNGTGVVAVLALARALVETGLADEAPVRLALWDHEETGLLGSKAYVAGVELVPEGDVAPGPVVDELLGYVNLDMIGSPNGVSGVFDLDGPPGSGTWAPPGSETLEAAAEEYFAVDGRVPEWIPRANVSSDHTSFSAAAIPVLWFFSGDADKSQEQAERWGGVAGEPMDACYHQACDDLDNVDPARLEDLTRAAAFVVGRTAGNE
jgi:hypothetical protein